MQKYAKEVRGMVFRDPIEMLSKMEETVTLNRRVDFQKYVCAILEQYLNGHERIGMPDDRVFVQMMNVLEEMLKKQFRDQDKSFWNIFLNNPTQGTIGFGNRLNLYEIEEDSNGKDIIPVNTLSEEKESDDDDDSSFLEYEEGKEGKEGEEGEVEEEEEEEEGEEEEEEDSESESEKEWEQNEFVKCYEEASKGKRAKIEFLPTHLRRTAKENRDTDIDVEKDVHVPNYEREALFFNKYCISTNNLNDKIVGKILWEKYCNWFKIEYKHINPLTRSQFGTFMDHVSIVKNRCEKPPNISPITYFKLRCNWRNV